MVFNSVVVEKRDLRDFCKCPDPAAWRANPPGSWRDDDEQRCAAGQSSGNKRCKDD